MRIDKLMKASSAYTCIPCRLARDYYLIFDRIFEILPVFITGEFLTVFVKYHVIVLLMVDDQLLL